LKAAKDCAAEAKESEAEYLMKQALAICGQPTGGNDGRNDPERLKERQPRIPIVVLPNEQEHQSQRLNRRRPKADAEQMMFDVYQSKKDSSLGMATAPGAGLPDHVDPKDWKLMPAGTSQTIEIEGAEADIRARGFCFFELVDTRTPSARPGR
jgi:hypothetical protein